MNRKLLTIMILAIALCGLSLSAVAAQNDDCEKNVGFTYDWIAKEQPNRKELADVFDLMEAMDELAESLTGNYEDYDLSHTYDNGTQVWLSSHDFNYYFRQVDPDNHTIWFYGDADKQEFIYLER